MNELIKGNMIMKNVADADVNMYVQAGWKRIVETEKKTPKKSKKEDLLVDVSLNDKDSDNSDTIKK